MPKVTEPEWDPAPFSRIPSSFPAAGLRFLAEMPNLVLESDLDSSRCCCSAARRQEAASTVSPPGTRMHRDCRSHRPPSGPFFSWWLTPGSPASSTGWRKVGQTSDKTRLWGNHTPTPPFIPRRCQIRPPHQGWRGRVGWRKQGSENVPHPAAGTFMGPSQSPRNPRAQPVPPSISRRLPTPSRGPLLCSRLQRP